MTDGLTFPCFVSLVCRRHKSLILCPLLNPMHEGGGTRKDSPGLCLSPCKLHNFIFGGPMKMHRWFTLFVLLGLLIPMIAPPLTAAQRLLPPEDWPVSQPQDTAYQPLPFTQDWSNTSLITTSNDWSGVPGLIGHRGDDLTTTTGPIPKRCSPTGPTPRST